MKRILLLILAMNTCIGFSQTILFNNYVSSTNNDLVNNFDGAYTFTQMTTNGITGGCVNIPTTGMSNVARYIPKYKWTFTQANPFKASICFKYVSANDIKNNVFPTCKFQLRQYDSATATSTGNFIDTECDFEQISVSCGVGTSYSDYFPTYFSLPDSWFKFEFATYNINQELYMTTKMYDLGINGTSTPNLISTVNKNITTSFPSDLGMYYQIWMVGYYTYGAQYLDNFNITSNFPSGTTEVANSREFVLTTNGNSISLDNLTNKMITLNLYTLSGKKMFTTTTGDTRSYFDISSFAKGMYYAEIICDKKRVGMEKIGKYE